MNTVVVVGSINMDVVARVPQLPRPAETVAGTSVALLKAQDVDASAVDSVRGPSGTALVIVDAQGGNTVVVVAGANAQVSEQPRRRST